MFTSIPSTVVVLIFIIITNRYCYQFKSCIAIHLDNSLLNINLQIISMQIFFTSFTFHSYVVDISTWATKLSGLPDKVQITRTHVVKCQISWVDFETSFYALTVGACLNNYIFVNLSRTWTPAWDGRYSTVLWKLCSCIPVLVRPGLG